MKWFKRFLIPSPDNDFRPSALQRSALVGMAVLVMISFSFANLYSVLWIASDWLVSTILPAVVTDATNAARADEGRTPLRRSAILDEAARLKAEDMSSNGYFAHWSPEGISPWYWFSEAGYDYRHAGENLAVHFTDSNEVVEAWLDSPTHRENIMDESFTEIGIGTAKGKYQGYDTVFVVQMFGTPAAPHIVPEPVVVSDLEDDVISEERPAATPAAVAGISKSEETVAVTEAGTVVYESFAADTNDETVLGADTAKPAEASFWTRLITSPRLVLQILYSILGAFVVATLLVSILVEWRRQHPVQIAYGVAMLAFIAVMFSVHVFVSSGVLIA